MTFSTDEMRAIIENRNTLGEEQGTTMFNLFYKMIRLKGAYVEEKIIFFQPISEALFYVQRF